MAIEFKKARQRKPSNREDYEPVTLRLINDEWTVTHEGGVKLSEDAETAYRVLSRLVREEGEHQELAEVSRVAPCVSVPRWKRECDAAGLLTERRRWHDKITDPLRKAGKIGLARNRVWRLRDHREGLVG